MDRQKLSLAALAVLVCLLIGYALLPVSCPLNVTVMDVGEGLCVVMRTPAGKTIVMDCGTDSRRDNQSVGESVVLPYLNKNGVRQIDVAILSHPHDDHISGFARLLGKCPAKLVLDPGVRDQSDVYAGFLKAVKRCGATYRMAKRGQTLDMGDGVTLQVLSPAGKGLGFEANELSVVVRVIYGKTAFVLTGDADSTVEAELLRSHVPVRAQVLQVGHHGSANASGAEWLAAVKPQVAVISCGKRNIYGHPARETLDRLGYVGARVYRTDKDGAVTFSSDGSTIRVQSALRR